MPLLNRLLDEMAHVALLSLHIPVLAGVFWLMAFASPRLQHWSQLGFDAFLIGHGGVYWLMSEHTLTMFDPPHSKALIYGAAVVGAFHLGLTLQSRQTSDGL